MAWDHLSITKPHLVYIILGGFTSLFMLCSSVIKERMYIGEATVATICGLIFGPHAANLINPQEWGSVDIVTIEFSRIVLVVQCFAVGVELPKFYMERHWRSVLFLLVPVMTFGWLITSLFVWWLVPPLSWLESLVVAACVTATDPVLASSVVGKGKFAKRVPKHLRDLLSAESGCNDGMAFPFVYLSLYLIQDKQSAELVSYHWIVWTILYECIFGAVYGFIIGYIARHGIRIAEKHELIDRESFLVFYFVLALFCAGSGSILGIDDLLVGFACGVGFSNDGWFTQKTEESHVSNVIDLLLNLTYFVFLGTIIPWEQFNNTDIGLSAWKLTVIAILVILFRRIPIMLALKPLIPDIKTWREALFAGHFGPIGVGAIFVAIMARAELEHDEPVPLSEIPDPSHEHYTLLTLVWPITTFLVVASIIVHGSSVAVFTLGKRINTLQLTMSYTQANEDGPSWMNRLPRITSMSRSQARTMSDTDGDDLKMPDLPPGALPPVGFPGQFLRRQREEEKEQQPGRHSRQSSLSRRRKKKWDELGPGGPVSQSAIFPQRRPSQPEIPSLQVDSSTQSPTERADSSGLLSPMDAFHRGRSKDRDEAQPDGEKQGGDNSSPAQQRRTSQVEVYDEGDHIVVENQEGDVLAVEPSPEHTASQLKEHVHETHRIGGWTGLVKRFGDWREGEIEKRKEKEKSHRKHEPARAYAFGNTIIVEDEDGEVVKKYELPTPQRPEGQDFVSQSLKYMGMGGRKEKAGEKAGGRPVAEGSSTGGEKASSSGEKHQSISRVTSRPTLPGWAGAFGITAGTNSPGEPSSSSGATARPRKKSVVEEREEEDDRHIRFTIGGVGQRMTKADFINQMQQLDRTTRREVVEASDASHVVKTLAKQDAGASKAGSSATPQSTGSSTPRAKPATKSTPSDMKTEGGRTASDSADRKGSSSPESMSSPEIRAAGGSAPSRSEPETAVERRRRLAVLEGVGDGEEDDEGEETGETPAERRRREAALGVGAGGSSQAAAEDSDDDDTERVPPAQRRGIRFADTPGRVVG